MSGHSRDRAKGQAFQNWSESWIKEYLPGSIVHNQRPTAKRIKIRDPKTGQLKDIWVSQRNDVFGVGDIVWFSQFADDKLCLIQCTMDSSIGRKFAELLAIQWPLSHVIVQVWQKKEPTRIVVWTLVENGEFGQEKREFVKAGEIIRRKFILPENKQSPPQPPQ